MNGMDQLGGGVLLAAVATLWLVYLVPSWLQRRKHSATERQVTRMQQALRVMGETSGEGSDLVEAELSARKIAIVAREARKRRRLALKAERERAEAGTREFARLERVRSEQEKEVARVSTDVEAARVRRQAQAERIALKNSLEYRAAALRRGRLLSTAVVVLGAVLVVAGLIVLPSAMAGWWILGVGVALVTIGVRMLAAAARTAQAYRSRGLGSAPTRGVQPVVVMDAEESGVSDPAAPAERADRSWTPRPLPQPIAVTREQVLAAARAEAEAAEEKAARARVVEAAISVADDTVVPRPAPAAAGAGTPAEDLRRESEKSVAALRAAESGPGVTAIESARPESDEYGWLAELEESAKAAGAATSSHLDEVLERRRNVG